MCKGRTGILLTFGKVPIYWSSKLQSEISLSTLEAEYIALSHYMRELVAGRQLQTEITIMMNMLDIHSVSFVCKTWEDNMETENLANRKGPLMTSRTKHIGIKYHWFQSMIQKNEIEANMIGTKLKKADMFTNGLTQFIFESMRYQVKD